ncbi:MAG TPA: hypothetical protein VJJ82_02165 [Candidatus Nanoarchaeia archaeon]|nr:hypothetical protein [Candidatus Nanoarchaeia archaeon]
MSLGASIAQAAPLYNLGLVIIALILFYRLFTLNVRERKTYLLPWKIVFAALLIFIVEELLTVLRGLDFVTIPLHINGFFEVLIIGTFIYALLLQKEHVKNS